MSLNGRPEYGYNGQFYVPCILPQSFFFFPNKARIRSLSSCGVWLLEGETAPPGRMRPGRARASHTWPVAAGRPLSCLLSSVCRGRRRDGPESRLAARPHVFEGQVPLYWTRYLLFPGCGASENPEDVWDDGCPWPMSRNVQAKGEARP